MALVSIARHGYSAAGGNMQGIPPQGRGDSRGWSKRSRKSNEEFLQSIDFHGLSGSPYAVTPDIANYTHSGRCGISCDVEGVSHAFEALWRYPLALAH